MKLKKLLLTTATTALLLSPAYGAIKLDEIVVKGPTWNPIDSGKNSYDSAKKDAFITPNQDLNDLFRTMPNVQYNGDFKKALRDNKTSATNKVAQKNYMDQVLDQRPQSISISGGRFYENQFRVDGRDATTRLPVNQDELGMTDGYYRNNRGAGWKNRSSNSEWVKPFDIETVDIYDSNIPAKYGNFAGGVVDVKTKKPTGGDKHSGTFYYDFSGSKWEETKYVGDVPRVDEKWRANSMGIRINTKTYDLKDNKNVAFQVSANRSKRTASNVLSDNQIKSKIAFAPDIAQSISKDQKVSAKVQLRHDTTMNVSLGKSQYDIDNVPDIDGTNNIMIYDIHQRLGETLSVSVDKKLSAGRNVNVAVNTTDNRLNRDGLGKWNTYVFAGYRLTNTAKENNCGGLRGCTLGGYGSAYEQENHRNVSVTYGMPSKWGRLEFGGGLQQATLKFKRNQDATNYYHSDWTSNAKGASTPCLTESITCKNNQYVLWQRDVYHAKDVKVSGTEKDAYVQLTRKAPYLPDMTMRAGIRYDYDTLLKNNVFAPRLSLSHDINAFGKPWKTSYGVNRYYAKSNAAYHIYSGHIAEKTKQNRIFENSKWSDKWTAGTNEKGTRNVINSNLKTPHKDEFSLATQSPEFGIGQFRIKGIYRSGKNEFTSDGKRNSAMTNDGWSKYRSLNLEYRKTWGANSFFANTTFSSNKTNARSYVNAKNGDTGQDIVSYKGKLTKRADLQKTASDYNKPQIYNFGYTRNVNTGNWGNVMAGITGRYTESHKKIGRTYFQDGTNPDEVNQAGCTQYSGGNVVARTDGKCDLYGDIKHDSRLDLNGTVTWDVSRNGDPTGVSVYTGISNLLNTRYKGAQNGRKEKGIFRGRSFTFGTKVSF